MGRTEGRRLIGKTRGRWENNNKMSLERRGIERHGLS